MAIAARLATFYGVIALYNSVVTPFWPVFLKSRGMGATDIALLFMVAYLSRMIISPVLGTWADHIGDLRKALIILVSGSFGTIILYFFCFDFWSLLIANILCSGIVNAVFPIMEAVTVRGSFARGLDYARVRVSGSISFVLGSLTMGGLIEHFGSAVILPAAALTLALAIAAAFWLPDERAKDHVAAPGAGNPVRKDSAFALMVSLLRNRVFLLLAFSGSLIQAGHGVYYAFGTLNWQTQGYDSTTIGALWAIGVIAEITLFIYSRPIVERLGPGRLLVLGGTAGLIRWIGLALSPGFGITAGLQMLHAFSYGATHLAVMSFMARAIPVSSAATAQSLFAAMFSGLFFGLVTMIAGPVFDHFGSGAFVLSAGCCVIGLLAAWQLLISWDGRPIILEK